MPDRDSYDLTVLSLGAGTQSSAVLMLALRGELPDSYPPLDAAIFADTGDEPKAVYDYLAVLDRECERHDVPLHVVNGGGGRSLAEYATDVDRPGGDKLGIPAYVGYDDGTIGMARRKCTQEFKIRPIRRQVRALLKEHGGQRALQLIGISLDEVQRMKPSDVGYVTHAWPLVDLGWRRNQSIAYLERVGLPSPPRSACVYCPYRSDEEWRALRDNDPAGWEYAIAVDRQLREANRIEAERDRQTGRKMAYQRGDLFVHRSGVPLAEADLTTEEDHGQMPLWSDECEGMCGL